MEKNQYDLCLEVLEVLHQAGLLAETVIVGSWCIPFYAGYFAGMDYSGSLRTRDIDFLLPRPEKLRTRANIPELLKSLGFISDRVGEAGYLRLLHPDLIVEFLVPERGRGSDKAYALPQLKINAQPLRFLDFLSEESIAANAGSVPIRLPHPARFALHKLLIASRRSKKGKTEKDIREAVKILEALIRKGEGAFLARLFQSLPVKWKKASVAILERENAGAVLIVLSTSETKKQ